MVALPRDLPPLRRLRLGAGVVPPDVALDVSGPASVPALTFLIGLSCACAGVPSCCRSATRPGWACQSSLRRNSDPHRSLKPSRPWAPRHPASAPMAPLACFCPVRTSSHVDAMCHSGVAVREIVHRPEISSDHHDLDAIDNPCDRAGRRLRQAPADCPSPLASSPPNGHRPRLARRPHSQGHRAEPRSERQGASPLCGHKHFVRSTMPPRRRFSDALCAGVGQT